MHNNSEKFLTKKIPQTSRIIYSTFRGSQFFQQTNAESTQKIYMNGLNNFLNSPQQNTFNGLLTQKHLKSQQKLQQQSVSENYRAKKPQNLRKTQDIKQLIYIAEHKFQNTIQKRVQNDMIIDINNNNPVQDKIQFQFKVPKNYYGEFSIVDIISKLYKNSESIKDNQIDNKVWISVKDKDIKFFAKYPRKDNSIIQTAEFSNCIEIKGIIRDLIKQEQNNDLYYFEKEIIDNSFLKYRVKALMQQLQEKNLKTTIKDNLREIQLNNNSQSCIIRVESEDKKRKQQEIQQILEEINENTYVDTYECIDCKYFEAFLEDIKQTKKYLSIPFDQKQFKSQKFSIQDVILQQDKMLIIFQVFECKKINYFRSQIIDLKIMWNYCTNLSKYTITYDGKEKIKNNNYESSVLYSKHHDRKSYIHIYHNKDSYKVLSHLILYKSKKKEIVEYTQVHKCEQLQKNLDIYLNKKQDDFRKDCIKRFFSQRYIQERLRKKYEKTDFEVIKIAKKDDKLEVILELESEQSTSLQLDKRDDYFEYLNAYYLQFKCLILYSYSELNQENINNYQLFTDAKLQKQNQEQIQNDNPSQNLELIQNPQQNHEHQQKHGYKVMVYYPDLIDNWNQQKIIDQINYVSQSHQNPQAQ